MRILIVDDNPDTLRTYTKSIKRRVRLQEWERTSPAPANETRIEIDTADTLPAALEKLQQNSYEIFIVDLKIPGLSGEEMGGLTLISESLKLDSLRPIIVITGYGSIELARQTLTQGVFDFIEKSPDAVTDLCEAVQRAINTRNEKIKRSGNPFTPRTGMEPTVFGGRTFELEFLEEKMTRALYTRFYEHFLLLGNWGIGKSTLLVEFKRIIQSRGHLAALLPLEPFPPGTRIDEAAVSIVEGILRDLPYPVSRFKRVLGYFGSIGFTILGTGFQISRDTSKKMISPQAFLHDTLLHLWQDLKDITEVFVILLDNLENLKHVSEVIITLKQTLSMASIRKLKILLGIATTPAFWVQLTSYSTHPTLARYFLSRLRLGPLKREELTETILKSLAGTGVSFSPEITQRIFEYTGGHPFEMQLLCYNLFKNQLSGRVDIDLFEKALGITIQDMEDVIFRQWIEQIRDDELYFMRLMARSEGPLSAADIGGLTGPEKRDVPTNNISACLQSLEKKEFITKSDTGLYALSDPLFRLYLKEYR